ncbi:MAG: tRNA (N(6)-L-threonylcarbamoyladenosine(37)-C(2))-methylthiotransferase MtaB [Firmicutes bacterium]|jgi:MiaB-like protein|nr:tRNA (N(6)-L-threonylcarbamoyladenosine(37)-C(2))-methylthiotransferase MtaB [Bacillota bacterium]
MKFNIVTFGCKVNQYESNMMKEKMLSSNFFYEENMSDANIIIVNTCSVTNVADKKCLKMIRKIKREYPNALLVVAGCSSQNNQNVYEALDIDILLGNKDKSKIAELIKEYLDTEKKYVKFYNERDLDFEDMLINDYNHVRAFVKIEDGCDNFCSYCIIPFVRGSVRSKDFDTVIKEAKLLTEHGHKEIVLTGIHTGHYMSNNHDLTDLINELSKIDDLLRIRISSIEITELNDKFLEMLKINKKVCNHLHIPLQAGSDEILKRMNRKYDLAYYEDKINKIRGIRPDISITTDIIVGFPYETDELFSETLEFSKKMNFSKIHVFPYSIRVGTAAASMPNQVDETTKKVRVKKLMALSEKQEKEYYEKFKGKELDILVEECDNNVSIGHTSNYLMVTLNENLLVGKIYKRIL